MFSRISWILLVEIVRFVARIICFSFTVQREFLLLLIGSMKTLSSFSYLRIWPKNERFVSFRSVPFRFVLFRSVSFRFVPFRFVSFRSRVKAQFSTFGDEHVSRYFCVLTKSALVLLLRCARGQGGGRSRLNYRCNFSDGRVEDHQITDTIYTRNFPYYNLSCNSTNIPLYHSDTHCSLG